MEIIEAIKNRRSIRSYKPEPVPKKVLEEILDIARWAPSASNTQPWEFAVIGGKVMEDLSNVLVEKVKAEWDRERLTFRSIHPDIPSPPLPEPYLKRASALRAKIDNYQFPPGTPGLDEKRSSYLHFGGRFYGAPNAIVLYTEKALGPKGVFDVGIVAQTIVLAALGRGLGTCLLAMPIYWPEIMREMLKLPESKLIALVIAIGYTDPEARINNHERVREPLDAFVRWYGI